MKPIATLTVNNLATLSSKEVARLAAWLEDQRVFLFSHTQEIAPAFTTRLYPMKRDPKVRQDE